MTERLTKIMRSLSEWREKVNTIAAVAEPTEAQTAELTELRTKLTAGETEYREALDAEGDEVRDVTVSAEDRERLELRSKTGLGHYIAAAVNGTQLPSEAAEYAAACGVDGGQAPVDLLETREVETREVTPGVIAPGATAPIAPVLFARTAAASLGVAFPSVPTGQAQYPVMTTAPTAGVVAKDSASASTSGAFRLDSRKPVRVTGQFQVRVEDLALLPGMEESLRMGLDDVLGNVVDNQVFNGAAAAFNTDGEIRGLFVQAADKAKEGALVTFDTAVEIFASLVDGTYAEGFSDLRATIGTATFAKIASTFRGTAGDTSAYSYLRSMLGGLRVSSRMPAVASKGQKGLVAKTARSQPIRVPVWRGLQFVRDIYGENASKGMISVTAYLLIGDPHLPYGQSTIVEIHPQVAA